MVVGILGKVSGVDLQPQRPQLWMCNPVAWRSTNGPKRGVWKTAKDLNGLPDYLFCLLKVNPFKHVNIKFQWFVSFSTMGFITIFLKLFREYVFFFRTTLSPSKSKLNRLQLGSKKNTCNSQWQIGAIFHFSRTFPWEVRSKFYYLITDLVTPEKKNRTVPKWGWVHHRL